MGVLVQQVGATFESSGVARESVGVSVTREIPSVTPASMGIPGGFFAATVEATLVEPDLGTVMTKRSPWDRSGGWPPADGDPVVVSATVDDGATESLRFRGVVESAVGGARGDVRVTAVDDFGRFSRRVVIEPVANKMPGVQGRWVVDDRPIIQPRTRHEWYVEQACRAAGYRFGPMPLVDGALYVPLMGGLLPAGDKPHARLLTPHRDGQKQGEGRWAKTPWGLGWSPSTRGTWLGDNSYDYVYESYGSDLTIGVMVARPAPDVEGRVEVGSKQHNHPRIAPAVEVNASHDDYEVRVVDHRGTLAATSGQWAGEYMQIVGRSYQDTYELWIDGSLADRDYHSPAVTYGELISIRGDDLTVGHVYAGTRAETEHILPANATMHVGDMLVTEHVAGRRIDSTVLELIREILTSTASTMWFTADGHLHWAHPDALVGAPVKRTLTSDADLLDLGWEQSIRNVRSTVTVTGQSADVTCLPRPQHVLWVGQGETVPRDGGRKRIVHDTEQWATPENNVEWFDWPLTEGLGNHTLWGSGKGAFATLTGNWWGYTKWTADKTETLGAGRVQAAYRVTSQAYKIRQEAIFQKGDDVEQVGFRFPDEYFTKAEYPHMVAYNEHPLPVIRGWGSIRWDEIPPITIGSGPESAVEYTHDLGWWVQGPDRSTLAGWIASAVTRSRGLIRNLPIVPRHDIDLGDVIEVVEDKVYHLTAKCLVVGVREEYTNEGASMTLTLRVIAVTTERSFTLDVDLLDGPKEIT